MGEFKKICYLTFFPETYLLKPQIKKRSSTLLRAHLSAVEKPFISRWRSKNGITALW